MINLPDKSYNSLSEEDKAKIVELFILFFNKIKPEPPEFTIGGIVNKNKSNELPALDGVQALELVVGPNCRSRLDIDYNTVIHLGFRDV